MTSPTPLRALVAGAVFTALAGPISAQQVENETNAEDSSSLEMDRMTVFGERIYRNRTDATNPVLSYGGEFFQRYEPESVGDMLKRVPSVAFSGDVGEFDGPQLRGLPTGYTQVLINGERIPGSGSNRSVFVDRIPAELVERVEIVRSPTANFDAQGIGGTINIVLKDSMSFDGLAVSVGGSYFEADDMRDLDDKFRKRGSLTLGRQFGDVAALLSASFTERRTPKNKETSVFEDGELDEFVTEADVRESDDFAFNWDFDWQPGARTRLALDGFFIQTDRTEREFVEVFEPDVTDLARFRDEKVNVDVSAFEALERETQLEDIDQTQWQIKLGGEQRIGENAQVNASLSFARFNDDIEEDEAEFDLEDDEREFALETIDRTDEELEFKISVEQQLAANQKLTIGSAVRFTDRDEENREFERDEGEPFEEETPSSGVFSIEEMVVAGFISHGWTPAALSGLSLESGIRLEFTDVEGENTVALQPETDDSYVKFTPSFNLRYDLTDEDRLRLSIARTVRRPDFDQLTPFVNDETPSDDEALQGNPDLEPETAWGLDLGWERQFAGGRGIAGVNVFYRDISDLIEITSTGETFDDEFDLFRFENVGSAELYGIELDVSTPLGLVGLPDTSLFGNAAILESEVRDPFTQRKRDFNLVPNHVFNVGFNHNIPAWQVAFGMSWQGTGESREFDADEIEVLDRDGFLEAFVEKRFSDRVLLRLTGSNLLDQTKVERKTGFDGLADFIDGNVESTEIELEETGPWVRAVLRVLF